MNKFNICMLLAVVSLTFLTGAREQQGSISQLSGDSASPVSSPLLRETYSLIQQNYPGEIDDTKLAGGASDGMLKSLDMFSEHLSTREFQEMKNEVEGEFGGVGVIVAVRGDYPRVVKVLKDSPAEKAGIHENDEIIKIGDENCFRKPVFYVIEKLRGLSGTHVFITVRASIGKESQLNIKREEIIVESIRESKIISPGIGYIKLVEFVNSTSEDLAGALSDLKEKGAKHLILDLRNNMGGVLEAAIRTAQNFLPEGSLIVQTKGKFPQNNILYYAHEKNPEVKIPMTVIVNRVSASASEILAGALKDHMRASVVGEKTFGKGSVQTIYPLADGSAIRLTTAHYFTPKGNMIDGQGVQPDFELVFPDELEQMKEMSEKRDSILDRVVERINGKKTQE